MVGPPKREEHMPWENLYQVAVLCTLGKAEGL